MKQSLTLYEAGQISGSSVPEKDWKEISAHTSYDAAIKAFLEKQSKDEDAFLIIKDKETGNHCRMINENMSLIDAEGRIHPVPTETKTETKAPAKAKSAPKAKKTEDPEPVVAESEEIATESEVE